jgi:hypothetical protein
VITITNTGSMPLAWFGDLVVDGDAKLKEAIYIDYALMQFEGGTWAEADDNFILDGVGSGPYPGWYDTLASQSGFGVVSLNVFDGNSGMGVAPYEFKGALKPGFSYKLTLRFGFAEGAGNDYQGEGPVNVSFKVFATQVNADAIDAHQAGLSVGADLPWMQTQLNNQTP